jgi:hypothetical protein
MRPYVEAMWAERAPLVERVVNAVTRDVAGYRTTPSSEVWIGMMRILERTVTGNPFDEPTDDDRLAAFGTGIQGAGAGIRSEELVAAVLIGAREVEDDVMRRAAADGVPADDRLAAGRLSRRWAEQIAVWAAQGLVGAGAENLERHTLEHRLIDALRNHHPDKAIREAANALGIDPNQPRHAVVAVSSGPDDDVSVTALRLANPGGIWSESPTGPEVAGLIERIPQVPPGLIVGVAGPATIADSPATFVDATRASRVGRRFGRRGVVNLTALGLLVPLHEDAALAARLTARWLMPLADEPRHDLVETLSSWLANDGHVERVCREFGVHANTIRNRLARIDALLGLQWRAPQHRAEIWAALEVSATRP